MFEVCVCVDLGNCILGCESGVWSKHMFTLANSPEQQPARNDYSHCSYSKAFWRSHEWQI